MTERARIRSGLAALAVAGLVLSGALAAQAAPAPTAVAQSQVMFAIVYHAGPSWKPGVAMQDQGLGAHARYMVKLFNEGRIAVAGPLGPDGGLILLHARDLADAQAVMAADPAVTAGLFVGEVRRFPPRFVKPGPLTDQAAAAPAHGEH